MVMLQTLLYQEKQSNNSNTPEADIMVTKISDMLSKFCYFGDKVRVAITIIQ